MARHRSHSTEFKRQQGMLTWPENAAQLGEVVYLCDIVDWSGRKVRAWRLSITTDLDFCIEAVEEALARFSKPDIFNTD